ncbi:MAG: flagellar brake protein [Actinomycetota bacterium]
MTEGTPPPGQPGEPGEERAMLPEVNDGVELAHPRWPAIVRSRVEDRGPHAVVVARPTRVAGVPVHLRRGDRLSLRWTSPRGLHEAPVTCIDIAEAPLPTWTLALRDAPSVEQRREAFRIAATAGCRVTVGGRRGIGQLVDLSEGGLRLVPPEGLRLQPGTRVDVALELDDGPIELAAEILRLDGYGTAGLRFLDTDERTTARLRSHVFALELAARRQGRGD